jgi:cytochrome c peroxidase
MITHLGWLRSIALAAIIVTTGACQDDGEIPVPTTPAQSLDAQLRQAISPWGVVQILPLNAQNPALVDLGRSLFFDKILSGNRDVACATCHSPSSSTNDGLTLAIGTGALGAGSTRSLGTGRQFTPRNSPSLLSMGLRPFYIFWDGRVSEEGGPGRFRTPAGAALPVGVTSLLAAQAMIPVTNRVEMRGNAGDRDVFGNANELALPADDQFAQIWSATMKRLTAVSGYVQKFAAAYPGVPMDRLGFEHAANAIAAFETETFTKYNTPFDKFLARDNGAMSVEAKEGALLFFGRARCSSCHNGPMLGGQQFASIGVPQLGPGTGKAAPLDVGRGDSAIAGFPTAPRFFFRVPPLRNVELTAPYMHNGAYPNLETVLRHYSNVDSAVKSFDPSQIPAALRATYHGDAATINSLLASVDGRLRQLALTPEEQKQLVAFLKSLTDPSARDMSAAIPASVPSGLPVRDF